MRQNKGLGEPRAELVYSRTPRNYFRDMKSYEINDKVVAKSKPGQPFFNLSEDRLRRWLLNGHEQVLLWGVWGRKVIKVREWLKEADVNYQVFKRENEPMKLRGLLITPDPNENQPSLFQKEETDEEKCKRLML